MRCLTTLFVLVGGKEGTHPKKSFERKVPVVAAAANPNAAVKMQDLNKQVEARVTPV